MRLVLVIFALWILVVEPTFRGFEQLQESTSACSGSQALADADQPIPPGELVAPHFANEHSPVALVVLLPDLAGLAPPLHAAAMTVALSPLPVTLCLPYPPSALPLRL